MSDPAAETTEAKPSKPIVPAAIALVALAAGVGVGLKVVGPKVKGAAPAGEAASHGGGDTKEGAAAEALIVRLDNLIVSPMGSLGTRYLIISVAFEVQDKTVQDKLIKADVPLRDAMTGVIEKETLESLGRPGAREALKGTLADVARRFAPGAKITTYIPQFLIQ